MVSVFVALGPLPPNHSNANTYKCITMAYEKNATLATLFSPHTCNPKSVNWSSAATASETSRASFSCRRPNTLEAATYAKSFGLCLFADERAFGSFPRPPYASTSSSELSASLLHASSSFSIHLTFFLPNG